MGVESEGAKQSRRDNRCLVIVINDIAIERFWHRYTLYTVQISSRAVISSTPLLALAQQRRLTDIEGPMSFIQPSIPSPRTYYNDPNRLMSSLPTTITLPSRAQVERGSRQSLTLLKLGIPTANIPPEGLSSYPDLASGVYYGWVGLSFTHSPDTSSSATEIYPAVLSIGYNPFYKNDTRSVEIHILYQFTHDFYGAALNLLMLGFIRPEYDYVSLDALVEDINVDCDVARRSLERPEYEKFKAEEWLRGFGWMRDVDTGKVEREVLKKD